MAFSPNVPIGGMASPQDHQSQNGDPDPEFDPVPTLARADLIIFLLAICQMPNRRISIRKKSPTLDLQTTRQTLSYQKILYALYNRTRPIVQPSRETTVVYDLWKIAYGVSIQSR